MGAADSKECLSYDTPANGTICFGEIIEPGSDLERFARWALGNHDDSHGWNHSKAVHRNLFRLMAPVGYIWNSDGKQYSAQPIVLSFLSQQKIAEVAVVLHDVLDPKYVGISPANYDDMKRFIEGYLGLPGCTGFVMSIIDNMSFTKSRKGQIHSFDNPVAEAVRLAVRDSDWIDRVDHNRCWDYNRLYKQDEIVVDGERRVYEYTMDRLTAYIAKMIVEEILPVKELLSSNRAKEIVEPLEASAKEWLRKHEKEICGIVENDAAAGIRGWKNAAGEWKVPANWKMPPLHPDAKRVR